MELPIVSLQNEGLHNVQRLCLIPCVRGKASTISLIQKRQNMKKLKQAY